MFSFFKKKEEEKEKPKNLKLIALCLVFEVANADNDIDVRERDLILEKIKESLDISILTEREIFDVIQEESQKRVSFYDIINDINQNLDKEEKIDVLKMLWEIAYADKVLDVDEERIIKRSAEMLGIKPSIVLQTKEDFKNQ
ncbi:MAG: TerB family tellurite resistance protein [Pseudomonadota bacterium]|nr:TerB family tellurite resistance protein [Pseudomonadota bacterium]